MKGLPLTREASGLFRALLQRVDTDRHRILLSDASSTEWHSLTFAGHRHMLTIRITGPDPDELAKQLTENLGDAELNIPGNLVADITASPILDKENGSILVVIEALTIGE